MLLLFGLFVGFVWGIVLVLLKCSVCGWWCVFLVSYRVMNLEWLGVWLKLERSLDGLCKVIGEYDYVVFW